MHTFDITLSFTLSVHVMVHIKVFIVGTMKISYCIYYFDFMNFPSIGNYLNIFLFILFCARIEIVAHSQILMHFQMRLA